MGDEVIVILSKKQMQDFCDNFCKKGFSWRHKSCKHTTREMVKCWAFYRIDFRLQEENNEK